MKKKLSLNKETIRNLTADELKNVAGAADTVTDTTVDLCCVSCDTCSCPCSWQTCFTCHNCITGEPLCKVTGGLQTCEC